MTRDTKTNAEAEGGYCLMRGGSWVRGLVGSGGVREYGRSSNHGGYDESTQTENHTKYRERTGARQERHTRSWNYGRGPESGVNNVLLLSGEVIVGTTRANGVR